MPHRVLPNSIPTALRCLKKARDQYLLTTNPAERALTAEQFTGLDPADPLSFLNRFLKETGEVDIAIGEQGTATDAFNAARKRAAMFVSHFHQVYDLGVARDVFTAAGRSFYGRSISDTTIPDPGDDDALADALDAIIKGEADRQAAEGVAFVAMSNPSAAQVATVRTAFTTARNPKNLALQKTDREREEASVMLPEALERCKDIYDTVEYFYRKDPDDSSRRQKCARWGVQYASDPNEPATPPTPPAPSAPNP
jgi:hypothetical protein